MSVKNKDVMKGSNDRAATFDGVILTRSKKKAVWPYKTPSPEFMGKSGFYFTPTAKLKDRVTCFCCQKMQHGWKDVKDLTAHHLKSNPTCSFSNLLHLASERANNPDFSWPDIEIFRDPLSESAINIRKDTFGDSWPLDKIEGASATSQNLVKAGFYYCPFDEGDDLAICVYCGVSLEGWEADDDPLFEHQKRSTDCYFLEYLKGGDQSRESVKRSSSRIIEEESEPEQVEDGHHESAPESDAKRHLTVIPTHASELASSLQSSRVLRKSRKQKSYAEFDEHESFSLTSHEKSLDKSDETFNEEKDEEDNGEEDEEEEAWSESQGSGSSFETINAKKKNNTAVKTDALKHSMKSSASPKKSKILDSSFDENDMFSFKEGDKLELPLPTNLRSVSPERKSTAVSPKKIQPETDSFKQSSRTTSKDARSPARPQSKTVLGDITNTLSKDSNSPKKSIEAPPLDEDSDDDNSIIMINNSKEFSQHASSRKVSLKSGANGRSASEIPSSSKQDSPSLHHQEEKEDINYKAATKWERDDPNHKSSEDNREKSNSSSNISTSTTIHQEAKSGSKSILESISRFFGSPGIQRSQSPFLDASYKGSDKVEESIPVVGPNDIPIEESTDHHIVIDQKDLSNVIKDEDKLVPEEAISEQEEGNDDDHSESNYQSVEDVSLRHRTDYWLPTDTDKLFENLEPLETAKNYLGELKDLDYELSDDVDGRVSYFINEMPDNELNMTITEWIAYSALQGKKHIRETCERMLEQFDEECDRALEKLKSLPTV